MCPSVCLSDLTRMGLFFSEKDSDRYQSLQLLRIGAQGGGGYGGGGNRVKKTRIICHEDPL